jgi:hypothetical protein
MRRTSFLLLKSINFGLFLVYVMWPKLIYLISKNELRVIQSSPNLNHSSPTASFISRMYRDITGHSRLQNRYQYCLILAPYQRGSNKPKLILLRSKYKVLLSQPSPNLNQSSLTSCFISGSYRNMTGHSRLQHWFQYVSFRLLLRKMFKISQTWYFEKQKWGSPHPIITKL